MEPSVEQRRLAGRQSCRYLATPGVPEGPSGPWPYGRHGVVPRCNTRKRKGWGGVVCPSPWRLEPGRHGDPCAHWSMDRLGCGGMPLLGMKPKTCSHTHTHWRLWVTSFVSVRICVIQPLSTSLFIYATAFHLECVNVCECVCILIIAKCVRITLSMRSPRIKSHLTQIMF